MLIYMGTTYVLTTFPLLWLSALGLHVCIIFFFSATHNHINIIYVAILSNLVSFFTLSQWDLLFRIPLISDRFSISLISSIFGCRMTTIAGASSLLRLPSSRAYRSSWRPCLRGFLSIRAEITIARCSTLRILTYNSYSFTHNRSWRIHAARPPHQYTRSHRLTMP